MRLGEGQAQQGGRSPNHEFNAKVYGRDSTTTYTYDRLNRQIKVTAYEYDSRNRLVTVKVNDGSRDIYTQYAYDNADNPVKVVTGQTSKLSNLYGAIPDEATYTNYEYDRFGNVTKETDALGNSEYTYYDWLSRPTENIDKNGNGTLYSFNAYGSMTSCIKEDETVTNTYSKNNLLVKSQKGNDVITYTYDDFGNVKTENNNGVINTYTYDADGNRKTFNQKEGNTTYINALYTYDNLNRMTRVYHSNGNYANYTYDANDRVIEEAHGVITTGYTYNKAGLVTGMTNSNGLYYYTASYYPDGNIEYMAERSGNSYAISESNYVYNKIGQLTFEWGDRVDYGYQYDTRGNRTFRRDYMDLYDVTYTYDKNNRLVSSVKANDCEEGYTTQTNYTYDNNGNMLKRTYEKRTENTNFLVYRDSDKYYYNCSNNLKRHVYGYDNYTEADPDYEDSDWWDTIYKYDPQGRRSAKGEGGKYYTYIHWDGDNIVRESGDRQITYHRGKEDIIAQNKNGTISYYVYNIYGDTKQLIDGSRNVLRTYMSDGFGTARFTYGTDGATTPFQYRGQYYDEESGLYYLRNRYYNPELGRFLTVDPAKDGLNWYIYCNNDPVNFVDPWGLYSLRDYCENVDDLSSSTRDLMRSAIDAKMDGFLSYENMLRNIVSNGGIIPEDKKLDAVSVLMNANNINVTAYMYIYGTAADAEVGNTGYTYTDLAVTGIESYWSLKFGDTYFSVNVITQDDGIHKRLEMNISYELNRTKTKMGAKGRPMEIKINPFIWDYTANQKNEQLLLNEYIANRKYDFAHEFGHSAFGLNDVYDTGIRNVRTLMGNPYTVDSAYPIDIAIVLQNYVMSNFKNSINYQDNLNLLSKYSPGWRIVGN